MTTYDDEDWDDDEDALDDDELELRPCPHCGESIYEESERCPACGAYVAFDNRPLAGRPWWWVLLGLAGVATVIYLLVSASLP
jgi:hypothetical protein